MLRSGLRALAVVLACVGAVDGCTPFGAVAGDAEGDELGPPPASAEPPGSTPPSRGTTGAAPAGPAPGAEAPTLLSPFHPSGALTYQRPIDWTIAAFEPGTVIRYTVDGSTPTAASPSAVGKITIAQVRSGKIQWIAGDSPVVHGFEVGVEATLAASDHAIVQDLRFEATDAPVITARPGATVQGQLGGTVWSHAGCPSCIDQVMIGIDRATVCVYDGMPGAHPGTSFRKTFQIEAPAEPGVYPVRTAFAKQYSCADALSKDNALDATEVARIVVE